MDRAAWRVTVCRVTKSRTGLKRLSTVLRKSTNKWQREWAGLGSRARSACRQRAGQPPEGRAPRGKDSGCPSCRCSCRAVCSQSGSFLMADRRQSPCGVRLSSTRRAELSFVMALHLSCDARRKGLWCFVQHFLTTQTLDEFICRCWFPSTFFVCLANSVICWVAHESSFFKLSIGRDNQVPWSPVSLLFLSIFPYQNRQPVKNSPQSVCSYFIFSVFPRTLPNL